MYTKVDHEKTLKLISALGIDLHRYYEEEINKTELLPLVKRTLLDFQIKEELPSETNIQGYLDWFDCMAEKSSDGLPRTSSGSFWTALWYLDWVFENSDPSVTEEDQEAFAIKMTNSRWAIEAKTK